MKKFLILMLVLCLASVANATFSSVTTWTDGDCTWTLDIGNGVVLGTGTAGNEYDSPYLVVSDGSMDETPKAELDDFKDGVWAAAGDLGSITDGGSYYLCSSEESGEGTDVSAGKWFQFDVTYSNDDFRLTYWDGDSYETALQGTIPEPITIALLGLGGLFLRRRK
jgi:hypothetical protein